MDSGLGGRLFLLVHVRLNRRLIFGPAAYITLAVMAMLSASDCVVIPAQVYMEYGDGSLFRNKVEDYGIIITYQHANTSK